MMHGGTLGHRRLRLTLNAVVLIALCLLILAPFDSRTGLKPSDTVHAQSPMPDWQDGLQLLPLHYDVRVQFKPETAELVVECAVDLEVLRDRGVSAARLAIPYGFKMGLVSCDGVPVSVSREMGFTVVEVPLSSPGEVRHLLLSYRGNPEQYDREQDRYWSRATPGAVWVSSPYRWLPFPLGPALPEAYWRGSTYRVSITVPAGWVVFSPGFHTGLRTDDDEAGEGGSRSFLYEGPSVAAPGMVPNRWFAGPYALRGSGVGGSTPYEVWGLPAWCDEAGRLFRELGGDQGIMAFAEELLDASPGRPVTVVQVPPEMGGGIAFPEAGFCIVAVTDLSAGSRPRFGSSGDPRILWTHEYTHLINPSLPEGLADYIGLRYLQQMDPPSYFKELGSRRNYFLESARELGDRAISRALQDWSMGRPVPEVHAFVYTKPALVWNMFGGLFGHEVSTRVMREVSRFEAESLEEHLDFTRARMEEAVPGYGAAFFDRWFAECVPMDLRIEKVSVSEKEPEGDEAGASEAGPGVEAEGEVQAEGEWRVAFTIRDNHQPDDPPAREAVPWVEVAVEWEGGWHENRERKPGGDDGGQANRWTTVHLVKLSGDSDETAVEIAGSGRPLTVRLDPNLWLLDYNDTDNLVRIRPKGRLDAVRTLVLSTIALGGVLAFLIWRASRRRAARAAQE